MIIDLDSHLREGYFLDEVYKLDEPFAQFTPRRANEGKHHGSRFIHSLEPLNPQGLATHKHPYIYDPQVNWRAGEIAERQVGGYDMARRLDDIRKERIDKEILFPTGISIATGPSRTATITAAMPASARTKAASAPATAPPTTPPSTTSPSPSSFTAASATSPRPTSTSSCDPLRPSTPSSPPPELPLLPPSIP